MTSWEDLDRLKGAFDRFDKDHNHQLDRSEFAQFMATIGKQMTAEELREAFTAIDTDGSGVIEFSEFVDWWEAQQD